MAAVEDAMWYYRALHAHLERELVAANSGVAARLGRSDTIECRAGSPDPAEAPGAAGSGDPALQECTVKACGYTGGNESIYRLLDAGCGTGGLIRRLAPRHPNWTWTGLDFEPLACELARARLGDTAKIVQGSVNALPFPNSAFDAVVSADVLCNVREDEAALREFLRVVRGGGVVIINVPAHRWLWSYHDVTVHSVRRYVRAELRAKLTAAGFDVVRLTHWNSLPLPLVWARRRLLPAPKSGSDVRLYPAPIERAFGGAMALERSWLACFGALPFGSSILAVARKPPDI